MIVIQNFGCLIFYFYTTPFLFSLTSSISFTLTLTMSFHPFNSPQCFPLFLGCDFRIRQFLFFYLSQTFFLWVFSRESGHLTKKRDVRGVSCPSSFIYHQGFRNLKGGRPCQGYVCVLIFYFHILFSCSLYRWLNFQYFFHFFIFFY